MLTRMLLRLEKLTGAFLGGAAVGAELGTFLICVLIILGPPFINDFFA